jgi:hypothetical protein
LRLSGGLDCPTGQVSKIVVEAHAVPGVDDGFYVIQLTGDQESKSTTRPASSAPRRLLATEASVEEISQIRSSLVAKLVAFDESRVEGLSFDPALTGAMIRRSGSDNFEVHAFRRGSPAGEWAAIGVAPIGDGGRVAWRRVALVPALPVTVAADIVAWPLLALYFAIVLPFADL